MLDDEPNELKYDVWKCGWAHGLVSEHGDLRHKVKLLKEDADRLFAFARHSSDCPAYSYPLYVCTCGLSTLDKWHEQVMREVE